MKLKIRSLLALLAVTLVLGFSACGEDTIGPKYIGETGAELLSFRIASLGEDGLELPEPVAGSDWDFSGYNLTGADFKTLEFNRESDVTSVRMFTTQSARAWAEWGIGSRSARPDYWYAVGVPATFTTNDYLYIKVASEDGGNFNYYRFYIRVFSSVTHLAAVTIDGRKAAVRPGGDTWEDADQGSVSLTALQAANAEIEYETFDANSTVKFGKVAAADAATGEPVFTASNSIHFDDQDLLYIEVTAQNTVDKAVYKFLVDVGRIATIKTLSLIDAEDEGNEVVGKGIPAAAWASVTPGSFESVDDPAAFTVAIELDDPEATYQVAVLNTFNTAAPASWSDDPEVSFSLNNALAIKVVSDNGQVTMYYKVKIELLAAIITRHPASDYYYYYDADTKVGPGIDDLDWYTYVGLDKAAIAGHANFTARGAAQVKPLSFVLNREIANVTYQWYEANSWYGGYGFDADGRIAYSVSDAEGNITEKEETGFTADAYHVKGLDEKKNVSLHNGGNNFYRLPYLGRPIPGATGETYTPDIDKRPFLASFTSESHYYWVVIKDTDTGRTVTSKRAAIVSERDPRKDHYIINLHAYMDPEADGLKDNPRNASPFTAGNHGDKYEIPIQFPAGFDIMDYRTVTCQALFYLADGREWIQNWTQGDFGFSKTPDEGGEPARLVLWYNLTNDNATRGLSGSGNEPSGSGLTVNPTHLIVQPAGTKPLDEMPPFLTTVDAWGRPLPQNTGDAQGCS